MKVFKDLFSGDEMFMDSDKFELVHDAVYKVEGKYISRNAVGDIVLGGANASAEEVDEGTDEATESGVDVVLNMRLTETGFNGKKEYLSYLKGYMKKVQEKLAETAPGEVDTFKAGCNAFMKEKLTKFKDLQFFQGESMDADAMIALMVYEDNKEGNEAPFLYFFKHGLEEEKL